MPNSPWLKSDPAALAHATGVPVAEGFRSVVQTAIVAERPAIHAIILMACPNGLNDTLTKHCKTRTGPPGAGGQRGGADASV